MALAATLGCLPGLAAAVKMFAAERWRALGESVDVMEDLHELVVETIAEEGSGVAGRWGGLSGQVWMRSWMSCGS